jgi:hypothetical protein
MAQRPQLTTTSRPGPRSRAYIERRRLEQEEREAAATPTPPALEDPIHDYRKWEEQARRSRAQDFFGPPLPVVAPEGETRPYIPKKFKLTQPDGRSVVVSTHGDAPTEEEIDSMLVSVYGEGVFTKGQLPEAGGVVGSVGASEVSKRHYASQAAKGAFKTSLATQPMRALLKRSPAISAGAAMGEAWGEAERIGQIPPQIGRFRLIEVGERDFMGLLPTTWNPQEAGDRAGRIVKRALQGAGLDALGAATMMGAGTMGRGLVRLGMQGKGMRDILASTRNPRNWFNRLRVPGFWRGSGATGMEDILRLGEEGGRGATGWGRTSPLRVPSAKGDVRIDPFGPQAVESGWGQLEDIPRAMVESAREALRIIAPLNDVRVVGLDLAGASKLYDDVLGARIPKRWGRTLQEWLSTQDKSGLFVDPAKIDFEKFPMGELSKRMETILKRYVINPQGGKMSDPKMVGTVKEVMDDISFLDQYTADFFNQNIIEKSSIPAQHLIAKAIRDALESRLGRTLEQTPWIHAPWKAQRGTTRTMGNAIDVVKGSPEDLISGLGVGIAGSLAGAGLTGVLPGASVVAPVAATLSLGGSPALPASIGRALYRGRTSRFPAQAARGVGAYQQMNVPPAPQNGSLDGSFPTEDDFSSRTLTTSRPGPRSRAFAEKRRADLEAQAAIRQMRGF